VPLLPQLASEGRDPPRLASGDIRAVVPPMGGPMKPGTIVSIPHCYVERAVVFQYCDVTGTATVFGPNKFSWSGPVHFLRPVQLN
jgi:hypothetical protein